VLIVPTAALDTDTALALTDDPHRSRLVVIHNDDPELVRDQLWPYRSGYREGGSTLTPAELVYDDERNLLYLAQVVRLALGVGFAQAAIGVVLAAVAASAEQRHTVVAQWAIGVPRRTTLAAHIVTLVLPTFLASMIGAAAGLGVGTLYLSYADAADSPLHSGPLYGFDLGGLAGWTTLAIVVMGVATLAAAPIVFARPDIAELRAE
jgi:hypothetical protein